MNEKRNVKSESEEKGTSVSKIWESPTRKRKVKSESKLKKLR